MGDMGEMFEAYKEKRQERIAKNPQRLEYAENILKRNGIEYRVCNRTTTQINAYTASGKIHTFYAGTGKIRGYNNARGIHTFLRLCKGQKVSDTIKIKGE